MYHPQTNGKVDFGTTAVLCRVTELGFVVRIHFAIASGTEQTKESVEMHAIDTTKFPIETFVARVELKSNDDQTRKETDYRCALIGRTLGDKS
jgi:hypothetical protein